MVTTEGDYRGLRGGAATFGMLSATNHSGFPVADAFAGGAVTDAVASGAVTSGAVTSGADTTAAVTNGDGVLLLLALLASAAGALVRCRLAAWQTNEQT
jgi:hypothetical protein